MGCGSSIREPRGPRPDPNAKFPIDSKVYITRQMTSCRLGESYFNPGAVIVEDKAQSQWIHAIVTKADLPDEGTGTVYEVEFDDGWSKGNLKEADLEDENGPGLTAYRAECEAIKKKEEEEWMKRFAERAKKIGERNAGKPDHEWT